MQDVDMTGIVMEVRGKGVKLPILFEKLEDALKQEGFSVIKEELEVDPYFWDDVTQFKCSKNYDGTIEILDICTQTIFDKIRVTITYWPGFTHLWKMEDKLSQVLYGLDFEVLDYLMDE